MRAILRSLFFVEIYPKPGNRDRPTLYAAGIARSSQLTKLSAPCFSFVVTGGRPDQRPAL